MYTFARTDVCHYTVIYFTSVFVATLIVAMRRLRVGCAHLPMPAWSGATVSFRLHLIPTATVSSRCQPRI